MNRTLVQKVEIPPTPSRPAYFWWLLANGLALSFAVLSWAVCLHVFGYPEVPRNYAILEKIGRLPKPVSIPLSKAPDAEVYDIKRQYEQFIGLDEANLKELNRDLMRNYLKELDESALITYVEGLYSIEHARPLTEKDLITEGFAVRARGLIKSDEFSSPSPYPVVIDVLFPTHDGGALGQFHKDEELTISRIPDCAIIMHVSKLIVRDEVVVCLTVVPISHGENHAHSGRDFLTSAPELINPAAKLPVFDGSGE